MRCFCLLNNNKTDRNNNFQKQPNPLHVATSEVYVTVILYFQISKAREST